MQSLHNFLQKYFNVLLALALLNQLKYEPAGPVQNVDRKLIFQKKMMVLKKLSQVLFH